MKTQLRQYIVDKKHHMYRRKSTIQIPPTLSAEERMIVRFEQACQEETPVFLPGEDICFVRTVTHLPDIFTKMEWDNIKKTHYVHELGYPSNLSPDYERVIRQGLLAQYETADEGGRRFIDALLGLAGRYRDAAEQAGRPDIAAVLARVPAYGATSFREALQSFRILHFALWLEGNYHVTCGRFDQYMWPYLQRDLELGLLDRAAALELLEDFFLSFNKDSDLYPGVQQGDNGQSMVLGGMADGKDGFNLLSELCLEACGELKLIDPKINLRVSRKTPLAVYEKGSRLTKAGLGFPQYSNDDVVIPGLMKLGYEKEDAQDYAVAACWEFIIPKVGADVPNIAALSFPRVIDVCLHQALPGCTTFAQFLSAVKEEVENEVQRLCAGIQSLYFVPAPGMNLLMDGKLKSHGKYHNFGIHGTGIATACDSLTAIRQYVFQEEKLTAAKLIQLVDSDFQDAPEWAAILRYHTPKMGQDNDAADSFAPLLLHWFAESLKGKTNCLGGCYRAGTGSAMYYLWHADEIGASPDGRRKGEPFGTNFSPSLFAAIDGPLSVVKSFTKPDFTETINGGPLTMEFAGSMFEGEDSIRKVAQLVKYFIDSGGHQLQLNAVDLEQMKDAQRHPERHRQLVVRIWGWSAYFVELDKPYQDHVMARQEYQV